MRGHEHFVIWEIRLKMVFQIISKGSLVYFKWNNMSLN